MEKTTMEGERILINLRGFCLYCLGRIDNKVSGVIDIGGFSSPSPSTTPCASPYTPLKNRFLHSLPLEERIAPLVDLCRYLGIDLPDDYAFGDGVERETLTPPLCHKCHELSARLCMLQEELQYIQTRINNTVKRIYQRVQTTCGEQRRGAMKREAFHKEFTKSKGLSRRKREDSTSSRDSKKALDLLKNFQMKVLEKGIGDQLNSKTQRGQPTLLDFPMTSISCTPRESEKQEEIPVPVDIDDDKEINKTTFIKSGGITPKINEELDISDIELFENSFDVGEQEKNEVQIVEEDERSETNVKDITNFLPSETLHWDADSTVLGGVTKGAGVKHKTARDSIASYKLHLQALSCKSKDKPAFAKPTTLNSEFRTPQQVSVFLQNKITNGFMSVPLKKENEESKVLSRRIDSCKVTGRTHRMRARKRLLLISNNKDEDDDEEDGVIFPP